MRFIISTFFALTFTVTGFGQLLTVSERPASKDWMDGKATAELISIIDIDGSTIVTGAYSTPDVNDPSLKVYPLQNGSFIVRENIANFILYDSFGKPGKTISNSTQSKEGESISELATDPHAKTIVIYNPKIIRNGTVSSRARVLDINNNPKDIFYSEDREIRAVKVAESGEYIAIAAGKAGADDVVTVMDKFGNVINTFTFDQEVAGLNIYGSGSYLTVYSTSRAAVYNVLSGERVGSTSFRSALQFANYSASDQAIVALTGDVNDQVLRNAEVHVINIQARKIARKEYSGTMELKDPDFITLERTGQFRYTLKGLGKDLTLRASF